MKVIHLADTHLGYSAYRKATDEGINQREVDVYDAFIQCIDYAIKTKPDFIIHAGDLFDSVRPTNRAITIAIQQILRLSKENIPFIVISGNHETPKLRETGNIFTIFEHLNHVFPIHHNRYEVVPLQTKSETVMIHAIPQCQNPKEFEKNFKKIMLDKKVDYNFLVTHGAVMSIKQFRMNEFNELFIPVKNIQQNFDYIALGHYHMHTKLQENAFYSGSTERLSFAEAHNQKGFIEVNLEQNLKYKFIPLIIRNMVDIPPIECSTLSAEQILRKIKDKILSIEPKDKIIRIRLESIPLHIQRGIDFHQLRNLSKSALHFEIKISSMKTDEAVLVEGYKMKSLADEFERFLNTRSYSEKEMLRKLGLSYIQNIAEQDD